MFLTIFVLIAASFVVQSVPVSEQVVGDMQEGRRGSSYYMYGPNQCERSFHCVILRPPEFNFVYDTCNHSHPGKTCEYFPRCGTRCT